jgi:hypothetical protein
VQGRRGGGRIIRALNEVDAGRHRATPRRRKQVIQSKSSEEENGGRMREEEEHGTRLIQGDRVARAYETVERDAGMEGGRERGGREGGREGEREREREGGRAIWMP